MEMECGTDGIWETPPGLNNWKVLWSSSRMSFLDKGTEHYKWQTAGNASAWSKGDVCFTSPWKIWQRHCLMQKNKTCKKISSQHKVNVNDKSSRSAYPQQRGHVRQNGNKNTTTYRDFHNWFLLFSFSVSQPSVNAQLRRLRPLNSTGAGWKWST